MTIDCNNCGTRQRIPSLPSGAVALCRQCGKLLERALAHTLTLGLAWASALLLLIPANLLPVMRTSLHGEPREAYLYSGVGALWSDSWPVMAGLFATFVIIFPLIRATLLTTVFTTVHSGHRPPWLGRAFRYAQHLEIWAMTEVLVLAGLITYMRMRAQPTALLRVEIGWGGWFLVGAAALFMLSPLVLDHRKLGQTIRPDPQNSAKARGSGSSGRGSPVATSPICCPVVT